MPDYVVTEQNNPRIFRDTNNKGSIITYSFDFAPWAESNSTVTTVTWTLKAGQASIAGQALATNVATANITLNEAGGSLIEIKAETGTQTYVTYLDILTKDPNRLTNDYGLCEC